MKGRIITDNGHVDVDTDIIARYAGESAVECFGVVGMAKFSVRDGLARVLKRDSMTKGVSVTVSDDNMISIDFHIITVYGVNIATIADNLINSVKYKVEGFTGMKVEKINVYVEGVRVID